MRWKPTGASSDYGGYNTQASFHNDLREHVDRQRRSRRAVPAIRDRSYEFGEGSGLYSDQMMLDAPSQDTRSRGRYRR